MRYIDRLIEESVLFSLEHFPVTAITGPRQCGKSTLARKITNEMDNAVFLDLERPDDLQKLNDPLWFFSSVNAQLFCIDEIQRKPELFPLIRTLVDEKERPGHFLLLGSASRDMLKQSSESLAGRISYKRMAPFIWSEAVRTGEFELPDYFSKGGFPRSLLENDDAASYIWREDFIQTFLERDLLQWASFAPMTMRRLWRMLAHVNGESVNYSSLASSLGMTGATIKNYIGLLASTYMVEIVAPWFSNMKKRLIKAPRVYVADPGIVACLLGLRSYEDIIGHPASGAIWEQIVLSEIRARIPGAEICYYRTATGSEMDFVIDTGDRLLAVECKLSQSPTLGQGTFKAIEDIKPDRTLVVIPKGASWPMKPGIDAVPLGELPEWL